MAKRQSFGDKVRKQNATVKQMSKVILAEKKENGQYRFRSKMVPLDSVQDVISKARS